MRRRRKPFLCSLWWCQSVQLDKWARTCGPSLSWVGRPPTRTREAPCCTQWGGIESMQSAELGEELRSIPPSSGERNAKNGCFDAQRLGRERRAWPTINLGHVVVWLRKEGRVKRGQQQQRRRRRQRQQQQQQQQQRFWPERLGQICLLASVGANISLYSNYFFSSEVLLTHFPLAPLFFANRNSSGGNSSTWPNPQNLVNGERAQNL